MCNLIFDQYGLSYRPCLDSLKIRGLVYEMLKDHLKATTDHFVATYQREPVLYAKNRIVQRYNENDPAHRAALWKVIEPITDMALALWRGHDVECHDFMTYTYYDQQIPPERLANYGPAQMTGEDHEAAAKLMFQELINGKT